MSKPTVEFCILESVDVTAALTRVRVQVVIAPSFNGFTSASLSFEVRTNEIRSAVRARVAWKIRQETGLAYSPDELTELRLEPPTPPAEMVPVLVEPPPIAEPAPVAAEPVNVPEPAQPEPAKPEPAQPAAGQRKKKGKK